MTSITSKFDLKTILIIVLIIGMFLMRMCDNGGSETGEILKIDGKKYEVIKREIDTVIVPVKQTVYKKGKTIYKENTIYVDVPVNVDTAQILKEYHAKNIYRDTLKLTDSLGYVSIIDTITKNSILSRKYDAVINKTIINDKMIVKELPKNQLYIGGVVGLDRTNIVNYLGPNLTLKTKKDKMYSLGAGMGLNKNISLQMGLHWKISLKKKK